MASNAFLTVIFDSESTALVGNHKGVTRNASMIMWSVLFGAIGMGYFVYGKRQQAIVPLWIGMALMVFPYFIASVTSLVIVGMVLVAIPYILRR